MTDLRASLGADRLAREKARHRHRYDNRTVLMGEVVDQCSACGAIKDKAKSKRGKNARSRGNARELYVERTYGPKKVGQFGDAIDNIGKDFKWQSKTTTAEPPRWVWELPSVLYRPVKPAKWFTDPLDHMTGLRNDLAPLLIKSWTHQGRASLDVIVVQAGDWAIWHGWVVDERHGYLAMSGDYFLDIHGRDE